MSVLKRGLRAGPETNISYTCTAQNEVSVSLSFFYGKPSLNKPELEHTKYDSTVIRELFEKNNSWNLENVPRNTKDQPEDNDLALLKELISLAGVHSSDILNIWAGECVVCEQAVALALVHQPLCFSFNGYSTLADGNKMHGMMVHIAKYVKGLNSDRRIQHAVGNTATTTQPHIHFLSVPVCTVNPECKQKAEKEIAKLALFARSQCDVQTETQEHDSLSSAKEASEKNNESNKFDEWENVLDAGISNCEGALLSKFTTPEVAIPRQVDFQYRVPLRVTVFCGKPILDTKAATNRNMLSLMSFTLRWDIIELATATRGVSLDPANGSNFYIALGAFLENRILGAAEFCCCVCPERKLATTLVHCPVSIRRDGAGSPGARKLLLKLAQMAGDGCRWTAPETEAVLGSDGVWQVAVFVAPICRRDHVVCEETARIAAKKFLNKQIASITNDTDQALELVWPDLPYDTALSNVYTVYNSGKTPKMVVKKIGLGVMGDPKILPKSVRDANRAVERLRHKVQSDYYTHLQEAKRIDKGSHISNYRVDRFEAGLVFTYALNPVQLPYQLDPKAEAAEEECSDEVEEQGEPRENHGNNYEDDEDEEDMCQAKLDDKTVMLPLLPLSLFELRGEIGAHVMEQYGDDFLVKAVAMET